MKIFEELTPYEKSVLLIWGKELDFCMTAHYPIQRIKKKIKFTLPKLKNKDLTRINKTLMASGFILKHPTGRNTTYNLSREGLRCCEILKNDNEYEDLI
ncbi:hypothetical protein LCGC14_0550200 [marine sediment metagenome]|uniref:ArnR1-like winged helix-turn-helix domain-containing protein n=1 Tax=marine sediment metagenome TaxID=412755 RepID=A0A0F9UYG4_9ZZZZ